MNVLENSFFFTIYCESLFHEILIHPMLDADNFVKKTFSLDPIDGESNVVQAWPRINLLGCNSSTNSRWHSILFNKLGKCYCSATDSRHSIYAFNSAIKREYFILSRISLFIYYDRNVCVCFCLFLYSMHKIVGYIFYRLNFKNKLHLGSYIFSCRYFHFPPSFRCCTFIFYFTFESFFSFNFNSRYARYSLFKCCTYI